MRFRFIDYPDRDDGAYFEFIDGKIYEDNDNGNIDGHIGPNNPSFKTEWAKYWQPVDFSEYFKAIEI